MSAQRALSCARTLMADPDLLGRAGPRSSALLLRHALERGVGEWLMRHCPGSQSANFTVQLLVLQAKHPDHKLAAEVAWTWQALSSATHFHGYELPPSHEALVGWAGSVERFLGGP